MPWQEIDPGKLQREIGENETFLKLLGDSGHRLGHEHWAVNSIASFTSIGSLANEDLPALFLNAWKGLRFNHPSIAVYPVRDKYFEYMIPDSVALNKWADETFQIVDKKTADDLIPDLKPSPYMTITYLLDSNEILLHTAHWRTDGLGVMYLMNALFDLVATPSLDDPNALPWGQETTRLAPSVEDAAQIPTTPTDSIKDFSRRCVETFYHAAAAVGIPYKGEVATLPSGTRSSRLTFSTSETSSIISQCKARGYSVTSAVHASIAAANHAFAYPQNQKKHYTSTVRFSLRPFLPEPYSTPAYASGLYTTGWMQAVQASKSWAENAKAYNDTYQAGVTKEYIKSHREYALRLGDLIRNMPQGGDPPSEVDISSIGIAEQFIERVKGTSERGAKILSVSVGVETLTRQCVCFLWTFRDQIHLNLVYNESFHDERDTTGFLEKVKEILLKELSV